MTGMQVHLTLLYLFLPLIATIVIELPIVCLISAGLECRYKKGIIIAANCITNVLLNTILFFLAYFSTSGGAEGLSSTRLLPAVMILEAGVVIAEGLIYSTFFGNRKIAFTASVTANVCSYAFGLAFADPIFRWATNML